MTLEGLLKKRIEKHVEQSGYYGPDVVDVIKVENWLDEARADIYSEAKTAYQIAEMVNKNPCNTVPIEQYEWIPKPKVLKWLGDAEK